MGRYDGIEELDPDTNGAGLRIGIVMGRFNIDVGDGLLSSCTAGLVKHGVAQKDMRIVSVPGALEIPLIRGETYHFEIVSNESSRGITEVQLATGVPIANGILTTEDDDQAEVRMAQKGLDCALAAIEMARLLPRL